MNYTKPPGNNIEVTWATESDYSAPTVPFRVSWEEGRADLRFRRVANSTLPARLFFSHDPSAEPVLTEVTLTSTGRLTGLRGRVRAKVAVVLGRASPGRLTGLRGHVRAAYNVNVDRPDVVETSQHFQEATRLQKATAQEFQDTLNVFSIHGQKYQEALPLQRFVSSSWEDTENLYRTITQRFQESLKLDRAAWQGFQEGLPLSRDIVQRFQESIPLKRYVSQRFQEGVSVHRSASQRFQEALPFVVGFRDSMQIAVPLSRHFTQHYQEGIPPPIGRTYTGPVIPEPDPCYLPVLPALLRFTDPYTGNGNLRFWCERHPPEPPDGETIVIPIRRVYYMINSAALYRMPGDVFIKVERMSLGLDVDSWTYSFNAVVDPRFESALAPNNDGTPVLLHAMFNGVLYKLILKTMKRNRTFGKSSITITGLGWSATLDKPYSDDLYFSNPSNTTANQLLQSVLTSNGVGIGWDVESELQNWNIPALALAHQGSYVSALNLIASAAGGYMQPTPSDGVVRALARYPESPWNWHTLTPDIELPVEFTTVEDIEWIDKPKYNKVFLAGTNEKGIVREVTRDGSGGLIIAQMQTHELMTDEPAAQQLGRYILGDVGRQAIYSLRTPVYETTGIIHPGKFIKYVDNGIDRVGIVRGFSLESNFPEMWQTIEVETHVDP